MRTADRVLFGIRRHSRLLVGGLLAGLSFSSPVSASSCGNYHPPPQNVNAVTATHRPSVLFVKSGDQTGTAFLFDVARGLFLTARHVVEESVPGEQMSEAGLPPVVGWFEGVGEGALDLSVVAEDAGLDVAILQARDRARLSGRRAFELSFRLAPPQKVGYLGATFSDVQRARIVMREAGWFDYDAYSGSIEINAAVREGDSGAPVFKDANGLVIGIVLKRKTSDLAVATPIADIADFLATHAESIAPEPADWVRGDPPYLDGGDLDRVLRAVPTREATNFFLLGLLKMVQAQQPRPRLPEKVSGCFLYDAAANRELGRFAADLYLMLYAQAGPGLAGQTRKVELARDLFKVARQTELAGDGATSGELYLAAADQFSEAIGEELAGADGPGYVRSWFADVQPSPDGAMASFQQNAFQPFPAGASVNVADTPQRSDRLAVLMHDYQTALRRAADFSPRGLTSAGVRNVLVSSAWGVQVSQNPGFAALNYQALGDALIALDKPDEAASAYASAWKNGLSTETILKNFGFSSSLRDGYAIADDDALKEAIERAQQLDGGHLREIVTEING